MWDVCCVPCDLLLIAWDRNVPKLTPYSLLILISKRAWVRGASERAKWTAYIPLYPGNGLQLPAVILLVKEGPVLDLGLLLQGDKVLHDQSPAQSIQQQHHQKQWQHQKPQRRHRWSSNAEYLSNHMSFFLPSKRGKVEICQGKKLHSCHRLLESLIIHNIDVASGFFWMWSTVKSSSGNKPEGFFCIFCWKGPLKYF